MWMMNLRLFLGPMVDRRRSAGPKGLTQLRSGSGVSSMMFHTTTKLALVALVAC